MPRVPWLIRYYRRRLRERLFPETPRIEVRTLVSGDGRFTMLLERPGYQEDNIATRPDWAWHHLYLLRTLADPAKLFLDVGANIGHYTLATAAAVPGLRTVSFEPNPQVFAHLSRNLAYNRFPVEARNVAVGEGGGEIAFHIPLGSSRGLGSAYLTATMGQTQAITVPVVSLDQTIQQAVGLIKIDVQGYELHVFRGARRIIREDRPAILFEWTPGFPSSTAAALDEVFEILGEYDVFSMHRSKAELYRISQDWWKQDRNMNLLAIPRVRSG